MLCFRDALWLFCSLVLLLLLLLCFVFFPPSVIGHDPEFVMCFESSSSLAGGCVFAFQKLTLPISFACRFLVESRRSSRSASWKFSGSSSSYYRSDWQRQAASFLQCWPFCFRKLMSPRRRSCCSCAHPKKSHYYLQTRENMRSCCSSKMQMEEWILTSRAAAGGHDAATKLDHGSIQAAAAVQQQITK